MQILDTVAFVADASLREASLREPEGRVRKYRLPVLLPTFFIG